MNRRAIEDLIASRPFALEAYWLFAPDRKRWRDHFKLEALKRHTPAILRDVRQVKNKREGKQVFIFATLHYWIEQAAVLAAALTARGHRVTLAYLPYSDWRKPRRPFLMARRRLYARDVFEPLGSLFQSVDLLSVEAAPLPAALSQAVRQVSIYDVQYTEQVEDVDEDSPLFHFRQERNQRAAARALTWLTQGRPDVLMVPNGTVLELGAVYRAARHLGLPVVTYEFNDQREQIWLAQNDEVMRQNTDALWAARGALPLTEKERAAIESLESARMNARAFGKSERRWQDVPVQGPEQLRSSLRLDERPLALLAANVLGDSLTLGRNLFARSMAEWITRTIQYFAARPDVQLVVRIHPGERLTHGPSMADVVAAAVPALPENIHLIDALDEINTYDLIALADLGLVYTTTTGMEMAMRGLPVIVAGQTHYRGRGFTFDPASWEDYFGLMSRILSAPRAHRLDAQQVELAWRYAYRFFFEYPRPFPWRLLGFWDDYKIWPLSRVLSEEGRPFAAAFDELVGEPIDWTPVTYE